MSLDTDYFEPRFATERIHPHDKISQVIRTTFSFNLSHNIVALQVEKRCCPYYQPVLKFPRNKFQCYKLKKYLLQKVELGSTLRNILLQLATLNQVELGGGGER